MRPLDRRTFLSATSSAALGATLLGQSSLAQDKAPQSKTVAVELPRLRVPLSFIIDDSTCLVNMGRYCMPQFKTAWPDRAEYDQPWESWPHEIPDAFVRRFGTWCAEQGVRGKYSIVPYPACVGWLDRELPGWSRRDLEASLKLVRDLMVPNWDIHPEMITHTRVIDIKTGRPMAEIKPGTMENSYPQEDKSVDELASYLAYALRILKNCDLPCEGITTPGGFGNRVKDKLPLAVFEAVRDVYGTELPHYFKYIMNDREPTVPRLEGVRDLDSSNPRLTVNVPAGTGDWFGSWDGAKKCEGERYSNLDASAGRMVELIERRDPCIMFCHWAGLYSNGSEEGFRQLQQVITAINNRFAERTEWLKISEIGRYWTAKELTKIHLSGTSVQLDAPFACKNFTLRIENKRSKQAGASLRVGADLKKFDEVRSAPKLIASSWLAEDEATVVCFDLPKGKSSIELEFAKL